MLSDTDSNKRRYNSFSLIILVLKYFPLVTTCNNLWSPKGVAYENIWGGGGGGGGDPGEHLYDHCSKK